MTTNASPGDVSAGSNGRATIEIVAIGLGALMAALAQTLVLPVLPKISADIGASTTQAQWLLTATLLVGAAAVPVIGRLADMYGRRLMMVVALGALLVGSVIDALTDDIRVMIVGRAITGLSSAAVPLGISLLSAVLPEARKGSAVAMVSAMLGVGSALGLPLAGVVAGHFDYHALYWIGAVGAAISIALVLAVVGNPAGTREGSIDVAGIGLLVGGLVCLVLPLSQGSSWGWSSPATIGLLVASVVLLALLVVVEKRSSDPLVDMTALSNPPVAITNVASVFVGFALFASFVGTANYVQAPESTGYGFGSSVLVAGLCLMPSGVLMLVLSPVSARLMAAFGPGRVLCTGGLVIAGGLLVRIIWVDSLWQIILGTTIIGAGTGVAYASLPSLINIHTPAADLAAANGINTLARSLGSTLASAVGGSLLAAITITVGGAALPSLTAYRVLFVICAVASVLAAVFGLLVSSWSTSSADQDRELTPV
ncbi:MFS transporter [uncultured Williamsia sp.]|uniref:MFS transporter n=1 Tax=uncultured Williamsia sp. TaxID=259311 RepID=UPI00263A380E|nr:MFS transporter [uncultured Williamsia sp.]